MSYNYYNEHTQEYIDGTINADMSELINKFTSLLKPGAHILDAGSGTGRDTKTFLELGYKVSAFDASEEMVKKSSEYTGITTRLLKFEDMDYSETFDGIWACASLLHVKKEDSEFVFRNLYRALKPGGVLFVSYKNRENDYEKDGRYFNCHNSITFRNFISSFYMFSLVDEFESMDVRVNRDSEIWYNAIIRKI